MVLECTSTAAVSKAPEMLCSDIIILRQIEFRALVAVVLNENELFVSFIASVITSSNLFLLSKCPCFMRTLKTALQSLVPSGSLWEAKGSVRQKSSTLAECIYVF